jgi:molybdate transport system permease protein
MADLAPLWISLKVSLVATVVIFPGGAYLAWWIAHGKRFPGKVVIEALFSLPLVLPPTVAGFYLLLIFGRGTVFGRWLNDTVGIKLIFTWEGAVLAAAVMGFPLFVRTATAAFASVETELMEAARSLGAKEAAVMWKVVVPLAYRGVIAGLTLAFARALGEFGATLMIAGSIPGRTQTMPLALYDSVQTGDNGTAWTYTVLLSVVALTVLCGAGVYQDRLARWRT